MAKTTQAQSKRSQPKSRSDEPENAGNAPSEATSSTHAASDASDEEEDLDPELDALVGLAQMDLEAAAAYETIAEAIEEGRIVEMLRGFASDHSRHVSEIQKLVTELGGDPVFASPDPEISTFVTVAAAAAQFGPKAALRSLVASEQFTNATYEAALELADTPQARSVIERNFADEQRHLQALTQELQRAEQAEEHAAD